MEIPSNPIKLMPSYKIISTTVPEEFFNEFKEELKKIYNVDFKINTFNSNENYITQIEARYDNEEDCFKSKNTKFNILPFHRNCGIIIASGIEYADRKSEVIPVIDKLILKCMKLLSRSAVMYTATEYQTEIICGLQKCGWEKIGKEFTNGNTGRKITTLRKVRL